MVLGFILGGASVVAVGYLLKLKKTLKKRNRVVRLVVLNSDLLDSASVCCEGSELGDIPMSMHREIKGFMTKEHIRASALPTCL